MSIYKIIEIFIKDRYIFSEKIGIYIKVIKIYKRINYWTLETSEFLKYKMY
jgi:hypothetical protein